MVTKKRRASRKVILGVSAAVVLLVLAMGVFVVRLLIADDPGKRKRQVQMVTLLKPPPPPKIKEKPPEPKQKKEVVEEKLDKPEETEDRTEDDTTPGEDLGLDSDGSAGSDAFGLKAKKDGRALIGQGLGRASLLRKYAWYTRILQDEIRTVVRKELDEGGGIPGGNLETLVRIVLNEQGNIVEFSIYGSSGNHKMDEAVKKALGMTRVNEPPPEGMPKVLKLKISSKG